MDESRLVRNELVLRRLDYEHSLKLSRASALRAFALGLGLIQVNESRQSIVSLLDALLRSHFDGKSLGFEQIFDIVKKTDPKATEKALRYHLTSLKKKGIIEKVNGGYRFFVSPESKNPSDACESLKLLYYNEADESFAVITRVYEHLKGLHAQEKH